jgi:hypothetical protein
MKVKQYIHLSDFVRDLRFFGLPEDELPGIIAHEKAHYNQAIDLGYQAEYCIIFTDATQLKFRPSIHICGDRKPSEDDLKKILSAPDDPSDWDNEKLNSLETLEENL